MDRVTLTEFVGAPSETAWSRVEEIRVSDVSQAYIVFSVAGVNAAAIGRELVAHLRAERPTTFQEWYELLLHLNVVAQDRGATLAFAAGFISEKESGWVSLNGVVSLKRGDKFGEIAAGSELTVRSGKLKEDDIYILATEGGAGLADEVRLLTQRGFLLDGVISTLGKLIRTQPQADQTAVCLLQIEPPLEPAVADPIVSQAENITTVIAAEQAVSDSAEQDEQKALHAVATGPRRLNLDSDDSNNEPLVAGSTAQVSVDKKPSGAATKKLLGQLGGVVAIVVLQLKKLGASCARGAKRIWATTKQWIQVVLQKFGKRSAMTSALPGDTAPPPRPPLSTKKIITIVTLVVGILLVVSLVTIAVVLWRRNVQDEALAFAQPFETRLEQAEQLARLDPIRGREQLTTLIEDIRSAQTQTTPGTAKRTTIDQTLSQAEATLNQLIGRAELVGVPVWLDVQDQAPGFVANKVSSQPGQFIIADTTQQKAFLIDLRQNNVTTIDLSVVPAITATELRSAEQLLTLGDGIHAVALSAGEADELKPEGDSNREATLISSFESFIYVFNPERRNIYRYTESNGAVSDPIGWLVSPLGIAAEAVYDMAVDGDVWLTTRDGQLRKYTSGRSTSFQITDMAEAPDGPMQIVANAGQTYLYLFIPNQGKVVVLTKEGVFVKQIKSSVLAGATDVAVDEEQNQLYVVSGSVVYQVPIL